LETTLTSTARAAETGLATAFAGWARHPSLTAALSDPTSIHLVVDPAGARILHASPRARALSDTLTDSGLADLCRQIASALPNDGAPRLARLRLDSHRLAPPVLCWLARGRQKGGEPAILVMPTGPVTLRRVKAAPSAAPSTELPTPDPAPVPAASDRDDRFVWRIDAAGTLTALTGPDVLAGLVGRRWQDLAASGHVAGADAMLAALRERRTFRGEPATLDFGTGPFQVELSGAPLGRGEAAFSGFGGFGLIRSWPPIRPHAPAEPVVSVVPTPAVPEPAEPHPVEPEPAATSLSNDEHAAFREIARALGARYAGDEAEPEAPAVRSESGAIMPFPGPQSGPQDPGEAEAAAAPRPSPEFLDGLPLPALIHRGDAILAANRGLLDLTGYADLSALAEAGLGRVFRGLQDASGQDTGSRRTAVEAADGRARPVEALSGRLTFAGEPAVCLLVRPLLEDDSAGALTAERLAREAQAERAASAEAALDALETGVVTLDGAGRIVALNRAAAGLFGCDPREIVGGSFVALFDRESVLAVADILRGTAKAPRAVSLAGKALTLVVTAARTDGRRVAIMNPAPTEVAIAPPADAGRTSPAGMALARLDRAFREPLTGMIHLADAMLKEPFGALGDPRYRGCIAEIKSSGETMLERVGELLDLAAVEAGSLQLEPRTLALNDVAAGCVERLQAEAARSRIVVRTSFSSDLAELEADERSVSRAASLVIENAIRRSVAGGQIIVSTGSADSAAVALRVRDTGAGAAVRADAPQGNVEDGLALPRALVEANGGRLQLSARAEDGTLVEIIMPTRRTASG
jgi:signal transduction histidine kinase